MYMVNGAALQLELPLVARELFSSNISLARS